MDEILENKEVRLIYWVVVLVLVMLAVYYLRNICSCKDNFTASSYSAGATMRLIDAKSSQPALPNNDNY